MEKERMDFTDYTDPICPFCTDQFKKQPPVRPIPTQRVLEKLDEHLGRNDYDSAERHLLYWLDEAKDGRDKHGMLTVENELMGLYRKTNRKENALESVRKALDLIDELKLGSAVVAGTTFTNAATVYKAFAMPEESIELFEKAKEIFDNARDLDVCVLVFTLDCCYIFHADEDEIQRKIAQKAKFKVIEDYDIDFLKDEKIAKILYEKRDMDYLKQLAKKLPESIQETCSIAFSSGRYLEMNTKGVDKGYGMRWLVNYLGYGMDETIGIGDNYNDVEMIKTANDDIKELAQYVTQKDYDEGAVKEVIEKFVLGENHE